MCCALTLISTFLLASAVLADRSREQRSSKIFVNQTKKGSNFAGAVLTPTSTFQGITGTVMLPYLWGSIGSRVSIWFGLDDAISCGTEFAAGFVGTVTPRGPAWTAVAYWYPGTLDEPYDNNGYLHSGQSVQVIVSVSDQRTGQVFFENAGNQSIIDPLSFASGLSLCRQSAWWIVRGIDGYDLAHFGIVPISQPIVHGQEDFTPDGSFIYDIIGDDGLPLAVVREYGSIIQVVERCLATTD